MTDVFPRRNLPDAATPWARALEKKVVADESQIRALEEMAKSENRATAAVTADLARQLDKLTELLEGLEQVVAELEIVVDELADLVQELQELYEQIPKVVQVSDTASGFGLDGVWMTVQTITITPPEGSTNVSMSVMGSTFALGSNDVAGLVGASARILINNIPSPLFEATTPMTTDGTMAISAPQFSRTFANTAPIVVECQLRAAQAAEYPPNPQNYSAMTVIASFTG